MQTLEQMANNPNMPESQRQAFQRTIEALKDKPQDQWMSYAQNMMNTQGINPQQLFQGIMGVGK